MVRRKAVEIHCGPGDVVAIPLGNRRFAFGRIYRDASIGVFDYLASRIPDVRVLAQVKERFVTGVFATAIKDGSWKIVGRIPFETVDAKWPPAHRVNDLVNPERLRIYQRGEMRPATKEEVEDLEPATMSKPEQLVARIRADFALPPRSRRKSTRLRKPKG